MTTIFQRYCRGQSQGIYTNLWPTKLCRADRATLGGWYLTFQLGPWRLEFLG